MQHKRYVHKLGLAVFIYKQNAFLQDLSDSVSFIYVLKRDKGMGNIPIHLLAYKQCKPIN